MLRRNEGSRRKDADRQVGKAASDASWGRPAVPPARLPSLRPAGAHMRRSAASACLLLIRRERRPQAPSAHPAVHLPGEEGAGWAGSSYRRWDHAFCNSHSRQSRRDSWQAGAQLGDPLALSCSLRKLAHPCRQHSGQQPTSYSVCITLSRALYPWLSCGSSTSRAVPPWPCEGWAGAAGGSCIAPAPFALRCAHATGR